MIQAVTFDLWDTIVADDSDEAKRKAAGLPSKARARHALFTNALLADHPQLSPETAAAAFEHMNAWFNHLWKVEHKTPHIADRLREGYRHAGVSPGENFEEAVEGFAYMEVDLPPDLAPGIRECLEALKGKYKLGIISDAIVTPGAQLRELLEKYDLLHYFDAFVFSDEAGASKPDPKVFELAAAGLGVPITSIAHIGDREHNDILGPIGVGAVAVLYTGVIDRGSDNTRAHIVCAHHDTLAAQLAAHGG